MAGRRPTAGFTFLELMVVVAILAVLTAAIIPVYGASVSAMKKRGARGDLVATVLYLQELSIRQSRELRLYIDDDNGRYWAAGWVDGLGEAKTFAPLDDRTLEGGGQLPDGLVFTRLDVRRDRSNGLHFIAFYPNGACDTAELRLGDRKGGRATATIQLSGALGGVSVET